MLKIMALLRQITLRCKTRILGITANCSWKVKDRPAFPVFIAHILFGPVAITIVVLFWLVLRMTSSLSGCRPKRPQHPVWRSDKSTPSMKTFRIKTTRFHHNKWQMMTGSLRPPMRFVGQTQTDAALPDQQFLEDDNFGIKDVENVSWGQKWWNQGMVQ